MTQIHYKLRPHLKNATEFFGGKIRAALKWGLTSLSFANKSKDHHCRKESQ